MKTLRIEWIKLNQAANYILLAIVLFFAITYTSLMAGISNNSPGFMGMVINGLEGIIALLLVIFLCLNIGKEFSENTLRRSIIEGYSRDQFFRGKLLLLFLSVLFIFLIDIAVKKIVAIAGQSGASVEYFTLSSVINLFVKFLTAGIMAFFLVFVSRSIVISIVLYFVWGLLEGLVQVLQKFVLEPKLGWNFDLYHYLPSASIDMVLKSNEVLATHHVCVAALYLFLMMLIPYWLFIKRDIK